MVVAQNAQELGSSSGLLMFLLGGGLILLVVSAYRFVVNFRLTERGMARRRIQQANKGERLALYEASLWQARAADLEYALRKEAGAEKVPPLAPELKLLIDTPADELPSIDWDIASNAKPGGRPEA